MVIGVYFDFFFRFIIWDELILGLRLGVIFGCGMSVMGIIIVWIFLFIMIFLF